LLSKLYAGILIYIAVSYFDIPSYFKKKKNKKVNTTPYVQHPIWVFIVVGIAAGVFAGLFGKGGGIIIVPVLIGIFHYDANAAAATSLAALQLPVGLPSVIIYANNGHLNLLNASFIALGILAGAFFGSKLGVRLPSALFKRIYALFLLTVAVYMVYKYI
jgi:uncharacterized membrane protein YfcA